MIDVIGIGLAAGEGIRCRPLTLKTQNHMRANAAVRFLGHRVLEWSLFALRMQGVRELIMITHGKENRCQVKSITGYGNNTNLHIRYSPICLDTEYAGSADALLANLDYFHVSAPAFVFPADSVVDLNLPAMLAAHQRSGAVVTIASTLQNPQIIAYRCQVIESIEEQRVTGLLEKPSPDMIGQRCRNSDGFCSPPTLLETNTGCYLVDPFVLRIIARHPDIMAMRGAHFDIGADLLPWLVEHGYPIHTFPANRMGDLGNIPSYLRTMVDVLRGNYPMITPFLGPERESQEGLYIDPTSRLMTDPISHLTLDAKIAEGMVSLQPPVRLGKYVRLYPGVTLAECNIDDECEIGAQATIRRASVGEGSNIGPCAHLEDVVTGMMVEIHSDKYATVSLSNYTALGDSVSVGRGVSITDHVSVCPQLAVPAYAVLSGNCQIDTLITQT